MKFIDNEAELGSDNEENDNIQRNINKDDYEEILDKKLELEDQNLNDLIDDSKIDEDKNDSAAKFVEVCLNDDQENTVNVIKAIKVGSSDIKNDRKLWIDDDFNSSLSLRMKQKQFDKKEKEKKLYRIEEVKSKVLKVWENEIMDEDDKKDLIDEEFRRKIKTVFRNSKISQLQKQKTKYIWNNSKSTILELSNTGGWKKNTNKTLIRTNTWKLISKLCFS